MPLVYKFGIGDKVVYTNEFGVCWGVKTITAHDEAGLRRTPYRLRPAYHYEGEDTPWCPTEEDRFTLATDKALAHEGDQAWFQENYGWITPQHQLDALLDGDPFEGER